MFRILQCFLEHLMCLESLILGCLQFLDHDHLIALKLALLLVSILEIQLELLISLLVLLIYLFQHLSLVTICILVGQTLNQFKLYLVSPILDLFILLLFALSCQICIHNLLFLSCDCTLDHLYRDLILSQFDGIISSLPLFLNLFALVLQFLVSIKVQFLHPFQFLLAEFFGSLDFLSQPSCLVDFLLHF